MNNYITAYVFIHCLDSNSEGLVITDSVNYAN